MTAHEPVHELLTDTELEAMLGRLAARGWGDGLDVAIMAEVDATPQERAPWIPRPAWRLPLQPQLRLLTYLAIIGLLLAVAAGTVVVGSRLFHHTLPVPDVQTVLVPAGIETLSDAVTYQTTVVDGDGVLWAAGRGRLTRYDPTTGAGRSWTVDDDFHFAQGSSVIPAQAGGVWLMGAQTLLRFDGADFREMFEVGADVMTATEAPDGTLWAATSNGDVVHLVGSSRTRIVGPGATDDAHISAIAVDTAGQVWCGWSKAWLAGGGWVSRFDGTGWQSFNEDDARPLGSAVQVITPLSDGSVWVGTEWRDVDVGEPTTGNGGLATFDGTTWTDAIAGVPSLYSFTVTSVAPANDRSIWVSFQESDGSITVAQHNGDNWTRYTAADGLPGPDATHYARAWVVPTQGRAFVGTGDGIYALAGDRWERVWPERQPTGPDIWQPAQVVAVSQDEAWVASGEHAWHYAQGTWSDPFTRQSPGAIRDLLHTADGSVWVAASDGLYLHTGSAWARVSEEPTYGLAVDGDGLLWATQDSGTERATGYPVPLLWHLSSYAFDGTVWTEQERLEPDGFLAEGGHLLKPEDRVVRPTHLAIDHDGAIWIGSEEEYDGMGGLVRYARGTWDLVNPTGGDGDVIVTGLALAPNGDLWVSGADVSTSTTTVGWATSSVTTAQETWVARFDGSGWQRYSLGHGPGLPPGGSPLAIAPDGSIWAAQADRMVHFDGTSWASAGPSGSYEGVSVAADGTVWVVGPSGVGRLTNGAVE